MSSSKHILLAVLDWGLGHASRSVVIARSLLAQGVRVSLAGSGPSLAFLQKELPGCESLKLPPYHMQWGRGGWAWQSIRQAPKVGWQIRAEHRWLQQYTRQQAVDGIISDCRFGFYHAQTPSVLITHQLHLPVPKPWSYLAQPANQAIIRRFSEVWVPDQEPPLALTGHLSAPLAGIKTHYLGNLSRFQGQPSHWAKARQQTLPVLKEPYILVLLSGPEPQRTYLENRIRQQLTQFSETVILVRGLPQGNSEARYQGPHIIYDYAYGKELAGLLASAKGVICRSGYSTLMDVAALGKKAFLIPTPGQLEQACLARHWSQQNWAFAQKQGQLDIAEGIAGALAATGPPKVSSKVDAMVGRWLNGL